MLYIMFNARTCFPPHNFEKQPKGEGLKKGDIIICFSNCMRKINTAD